MNTCLLNYFIQNDELKSSCDFNSRLLDEGSGIYEVFRVIDGIPLFLDEHIERFFNSAKSYHLTFSLNKTVIKNRIRTLIESNLLKTGNIHFQYLENPIQGKIFLAWIPPFKYPTPQQVKEGVEVVCISAEREKPHIKRTNLPARIEADELKNSSGIYEVILVNQKGMLTEGSRSNIFFVQGSQLFTPPFKLVLPGITQSKIISLIKDYHFDLEEASIKITGLDKFHSAFICSTSNKVLPLKKIDLIDFNMNYEIVEKIRTGFDQLVSDNLSAFKW